MEKLLLEELKNIEKRDGFISQKAIRELNTKTKIPLSKIYGVLTFYSMFHTKKQGKHVIEICNSPSCYLNGSVNIIKFLEKELKIKSGDTTKNKMFSLHICSCIGCCNEAPAMLVNKKPYINLTKEKIREIITKCKSSKKPR